MKKILESKYIFLLNVLLPFLIYPKLIFYSLFLGSLSTTFNAIYILILLKALTVYILGRPDFIMKPIAFKTSKYLRLRHFCPFSPNKPDFKSLKRATCNSDEKTFIIEKLAVEEFEPVTRYFIDIVQLLDKMSRKDLQVI